MNTCLAAARFSQNISTACFLAELKLWEAELKAKNTTASLAQSGTEVINGKEFAWSYQSKEAENSRLLRIDLKTSWDEKIREQKYSLDLFTYFFSGSGVP